MKLIRDNPEAEDEVQRLVEEIAGILGHASYGTIIEMAWAYILGTPTIVVTDDEEVRNHPVINSNASWMLSNLDDAFDVISGVLGGYVVGGKHV
jgi:hypothetical protein